jgi:hypothetical protein
MKRQIMKIINKLLLTGVVALGLLTSVTAEEWKTYKIKLTTDGQKLSNDVITLEQGDKAEFIHFIGTNYNNVRLVIKTRFDEEFVVQEFYYSNAVNPTIPNKTGQPQAVVNLKTIYGPCKISVGADGAEPHAIFCNVKITRAHESQGRNVIGYSLVLPEGESGKQKLVLESSTDLVNWTEDSLGSKDSSDKKRFYRLRAVKE